MKISIVRRIGKDKDLPNGFRLGAASSDRMLEPVRLIEAKFLQHRRTTKETEALRKGQLWVFRNAIVRVEDPARASRAEIVTRIKFAVLSEERAFAKIAHAVDLFEKIEKEPIRRRIPITEEVRILVWRRDEGKCVSCGSSDRLEFDHIIPVEKGGSSTARNIQLLCETCNRRKGTTI